MEKVSTYGGNISKYVIVTKEIKKTECPYCGLHYDKEYFCRYCHKKIIKDK